MAGLGQAARSEKGASLWTIFVTLALMAIAFGSVDLGACGDMTRKSPGVSRKDIRRPFGARALPRKKRTHPKPRQYTLVDLERARDRVEAAERRVDNDRSNNPNRGWTGLERARLELSDIESQLRLRGLLE